MATGDQQDIVARIDALLPPWFGDDPINVRAILNGVASAKSFLYKLISYAQLQARIRTASDGFLDLVAADFFGPDAKRLAGQSDDAFRTQIIVNLFRPRATREAVSRVVYDLTGIAPEIFEPSRPQDTGGYGVAMGYGVAGRYGSLSLPFQAFITAERPSGSGIPLIAGYGIPAGGYSTPSRAAYASLSMIQGVVTDQDIYDAIDGVKPAGTIMWVKIGNAYVPPPPSFSLIVGNNPVYFGDASPVRLLGWNL